MGSFKKLLLTAGLIIMPLSLHAATAAANVAGTPGVATNLHVQQAENIGLMLTWPMLLLTMVFVPLTMSGLSKWLGWFWEEGLDS